MENTSSNHEGSDYEDLGFDDFDPWGDEEDLNSVNQEDELDDEVLDTMDTQEIRSYYLERLRYSPQTAVMADRARLNRKERRCAIKAMQTRVDVEAGKLRRKIRAWCQARPDPLTLWTLSDIFDELRELDKEEQLHLAPCMPFFEDFGADWELTHDASAEPPVDQMFRLEVSDTFDRRRDLLRHRAMWLSRGQIRPLTISDLPLDILRIIFNMIKQDEISELADQSIYEVSHQVTGNRTLQNARLACRPLCEVATPLLFPLLKLDISRRSLDFLERFAKNPLLASGVRAVEVSLAYRPKEVSATALGFIRVMKDKLGILEAEVGHTILGYCGDSGYHQRAFYNSSHILERWKKFEAGGGEEDGSENVSGNGGENQSRDGDDGEDEEEPYDCWKDGQTPMSITRRAMAKFHYLHEEQYHLIMDNTFLEAFKVALSRLGNVTSLRFNDKPLQVGCKDAAAVLYNENDELFEYLARPLPWYTIEQAGEGSYEIAAVRMLSELPIVFQEAGIALKRLEIAVLPQYGNFSNLIPRQVIPKQRGTDDTWARLATACQNIESLLVEPTVPSDHCWVQSHDAYSDSGEDLTEVGNYVGAILSQCGGGTLRSLTLDFSCREYGVKLRPPNDDESRYPADAIANKIDDLSSLRSLTLRSLSFTHTELEGLCSKLGTRLTEITMAQIKLATGSWTDGFVRILQSKLNNRDSAEKRSVLFELFSGEPFGLVLEGYDHYRGLSALLYGDTVGVTAAASVKALERLVQGDCDLDSV
ncbi:hypothetical protein QBC44DRAFT_400366 [Cladorrhinum sp. PSN332]|nr:hypothetical protein QBC44DRAFT_400366 [Cladorrhinum sp. PSN332]